MGDQDRPHERETNTGASFSGACSVEAHVAAGTRARGRRAECREGPTRGRNGNVIYGVEVTSADGTKSDVKIDAEYGAVLSHQSDNENSGDIRKETGRARRSICSELTAASFPASRRARMVPKDQHKGRQ